jgi:hypothetical protein
MASEEALKQAREIVDDLIASDSHVYIPISLYEPFVERIAAAIDGPPATGPDLVSRSEAELLPCPVCESCGCCDHRCIGGRSESYVA